MRVTWKENDGILRALEYMIPLFVVSFDLLVMDGSGSLQNPFMRMIFALEFTCNAVLLVPQAAQDAHRSWVSMHAAVTSK